MCGVYKTTISYDEYLRALALYTVAHEAYLAAGRYGEALNRIIMVEPEKYPGGHVDEAIYCDDPVSTMAFNEALKREGIAVEPESS
jgi:hypothetical protein